MRVDAHHHFWRYTPLAFDWIDERMQSLRRDFLLIDLEPELAAASVDTTVVFHARQTLEEIRWLLECAARSPSIRAVVGWAPLAPKDFSDTLGPLRSDGLLKDLRHVVQGEPADFLDDVGFNRGIDCLLETGLVYNLLIVARQLEESARFVDRHPNQSFVLDHIAKPDIANGSFSAWETPFRELARRENVVCKLSGMVTEAEWKQWSGTALKPYFDTALEAFGSERLMCASDWPVLTVASTYKQWWRTLNGWTAPLSE